MRFHRTPRTLAAVAVGLSLVAAACGDDDDTTATTAPAQTTAPAETTAPGDTTADTDAPGDGPQLDVPAECGDGSLEGLIAAAKAEGQVNLMALPPTWANYAGILAKWDEVYGIKAPVAIPDASSADEVTQIETLRGQPDMPESYDVGPSFTADIIAKGFAEPFKPSTWDEIPDALKDPDGNWVGSYYGVLQMFVNTKLVDEAPTSFADLLDAPAKSVAINGDPREAGAAFATVMAASIANGGSLDDIMPGIEFFAELRSKDIFQTFDVSEQNILAGEIPITLDWSYNWPSRDEPLTQAGFEYTLSVPTDVSYSSYYAQGVVSEANHPCAARLWVEHLIGDDGALGYLAGGAIPARAGAMIESGVITAEQAASLPSVEALKNPSFITPAQTDAAKALLAEHWGPKVADA